MKNSKPKYGYMVSIPLEDDLSKHLRRMAKKIGKVAREKREKSIRECCNENNQDNL